jgi:hypothetical protein
VLLCEHGERRTKKVSSTVDNYATAIVNGLAELIREHGPDAKIIARSQAPRSHRKRSAN